MRKNFETMCNVKESNNKTVIFKDHQDPTIKVRASKKMQQITRVISFTSGKGGVGKTNSVVNIAMALASQGRSVLILDADLGLANIDVMLGLRVQYTLEDVFSGEKTLEEVIVETPEGVSIIPAASGVESICNLTVERKLMLMDAVENLSTSYDYLLIDTQAGIGNDVIYFNVASTEIVCIINPEPTSLTDAYALIKVLSNNYSERSISILCNEVSDEREALVTYDRLSRAVHRFLKIELKYLGFIPSDSAVVDAINAQKPVIQLYPSSRAALALATIARRLEETHDYRIKGGMQFFFKQLLELSA